MSINARLLALSAGLITLIVWNPLPAQSQTDTSQGMTQLPPKEAQSPPMRDFQEMIESHRSQVQDRITAASERIRGACSEELRNFCSAVTPGEGRLLLCMEAHEDKLSDQCELALLDASRPIRRVTHRIERIAEACWSDIQANCDSGSSIAQCMREKRALLSASCQAVFSESRRATQQGTQQKPSLLGLPIYSSDGVKMGEVISVKAGLDGKPQMIHAELGALLGLGTSIVLITPDELKTSQSGGLQLRMPAEQVRAVLQDQLPRQR
jgi:hypothetical protein